MSGPRGEAELAALDYTLPPERIAQHPAAERSAARLLVLDRATRALQHETIAALPRLLEPGDLLVRNATQVRPARLRGRKETGGQAEALLLAPDAEDDRRFRALVRCRGRLRVGQKLHFEPPAHDPRAGLAPEADPAPNAGNATRSSEDQGLDAEITALAPDGEVELRFGAGPSPYDLGEIPLPPYIRRDTPEPDDAERYQTVYARVPGSVAAPTAGLHFSADLDAALAARGIGIAELVLHVGAGTFRPLTAAALERGRLHAEPYALPEETAAAVARTRAAGGRIVAVGTTTVRVLEHCADDARGVRPGHGETELLLRPGVPFRVVDALLTNFHLPRSSLLLLVAAFAGTEPVLAAYREALERGYRFYSYGDAMLLR